MGLFDKLSGALSDKDPEDEKLYDFVRSKVEDVRRTGTRTSHEAIWLTNVAWLLGYQVYFDPSARQFRNFYAGTPYLARNRLYVNKILPTVQNRLARLVKSRPKYQVRPSSNDQEDRDAAKLSEQVLDMIWQNEGVSQKQLELYMWTQQAGHAYAKVCWDPTMGQMLENPLTGEMEFEGDIRIDVVSPLEIFVDPLAKTLDDAQWLVQAKVRKLDYFKAQYPEKGGLVKEESTWLLSAQYENRINSLNQLTGASNAQNIAQKNTAVEMAYYERRSKDRPNGRQIITANGVVLEDKELPVGDIPFIKFDDILIGGKYYSEAIITHLRPVQDQLNRLYNKRAKWTNQLLAGKYLSPRGSELTEETLNDQSGEVVEFTPVPGAPPPTAMPIPNMPAYAYKEEEALIAQLNDISGINEVSRGQPTGGVTAAIGLAYLTEQDDTRIGVVTRRHELQWAKFFKMVLEYVEKFYQNDRLLKIAGDSGQYLVKSFVGADLRGNTDVAVIEGSTLPGSITAKRDLILALFQQGLLGNPQDPKARDKILKLLEFGDVNGIWEDYSIDMNQISSSISDLKQGIPSEISDLDNNELHVLEKNKFRKGDNFKKLPPNAQHLFLLDIEERIKILTNQSNPQLAAQEQELEQLELQASQMPSDEEIIAQSENTPIEETEEVPL